MFHPKKQQPSAQANLRLPKLQGSPGFADVQYALGQAQKSSGRIVELPWASAETRSSYMLSIKAVRDQGEPLWTMHAGDGEDARVLWDYATGDVQLVLNLALAESTGGQLQDSAQDGTYVSTIKPKDGADAGRSGGIYSAPSGAQAATVDRTQTESGKRAKAILEGDLKNMQVPNLLQSIVISQMTGRLGVQSAQGSADVYFEEGTPTHAQVGATQGDMALIELLMWSDGEFHFYPSENTSHRTVNKRLDGLLMEGVALVDQNNYLTDQGVTLQSYLLRKNLQLSEAQFEQMVSHGAPLDMSMQKRFYQAIDNKTTLLELLRRMPLSKTEWIPLVFNMVSCKLVESTARAPQAAAAKAPPLQALQVDHAAIDAVVRAMQRPETGLLTYPAFLFFVQQEFFRFEAFGWPFSIAVFEMRLQGQGEFLPLPAIKELAQRISSVKRQTDFLAHYGTLDYACVLSNTNTASAAIFATRLVEVVRSAPVPQIPDVRNLTISMGIAAIPEDCHDLGLVLASACEAKNKAREKGVPFMLFKDLQHG